MLENVWVWVWAEGQSPRSGKIHCMLEFGVWSKVQGSRSLVGDECRVKCEARVHAYGVQRSELRTRVISN